MTPALALHGVTTRYGATTAVQDVSLAVAAGEFLTLLGPSGAGKSTLLLTIAGLLAPAQGAVLLHGRDITRVPAERRGFGLVLQDHGLLPHKTAAGNVAFPLRLRRVRRAEAAARARAMLDRVRLAEFADRRPDQLSGGQRQRVALARALVAAPELLLLDEPMAALDRNLRLDLREELKALQRALGGTFISVTHDQEEALSLADRIAVLRAGRLVQVGTARALYEAPRTRFVAEFLGRSNFLRGTVREVRSGGFVYAAEGGRFVQAAAAGSERPPLGAALLLSLRPEKLALLDARAPADNAVEGAIAAASFHGDAWEIVACTPLGPLRAKMPSWRAGFTPEPGLPVRLGWAADAGTPVAED